MLLELYYKFQVKLRASILFWTRSTDGRRPTPEIRVPSLSLVVLLPELIQSHRREWDWDNRATMNKVVFPMKLNFPSTKRKVQSALQLIARNQLRELLFVWCFLDSGDCGQSKSVNHRSRWAITTADASISRVIEAWISQREYGLEAIYIKTMHVLYEWCQRIDKHNSAQSIAVLSPLKVTRCWISAQFEFRVQNRFGIATNSMASYNIIARVLPSFVVLG